MEEITQLRFKLRKIVNKMRMRVASECFYAWLEHTEAEIFKRENPAASSDDDDGVVDPVTQAGGSLRTALDQRCVSSSSSWARSV